jgi:hypothetical protein
MTQWMHFTIDSFFLKELRPWSVYLCHQKEFSKPLKSEECFSFIKNLQAKKSGAHLNPSTQEVEVGGLQI